MLIHWYPGHMATALRHMKENLKAVDLVIEILDARAPWSSRNPLLQELRGSRPALLVLNKADLADPQVTAQWLELLSATSGQRALSHAQGDKGLARSVVQATRELAGERWGRSGPMLALVVGIPNVGKSTIINSLAGRTVTKTGNTPGLTQAQQRVAVDKNLALMDTPGVLWHKLEPEVCAQRLALSGAISDRVLDTQALALLAVDWIRSAYPGRLEATYGVQLDPTAIAEDCLLAVGRKRGCVVKGGGVDLQKASDIVLRDLRGGKLGRVSFERPADIPRDQS